MAVRWKHGEFFCEVWHHSCIGWLAEWTIALVLKTSGRSDPASREFESHTIRHNLIGLAMDIKIYNENCVKTLEKIEDNTINLVVTSPPYDDLRTYNNSSTWNYDSFKTIANLLYNKISDGGVIVWIISDSTINGSESGSSFRQALYFVEIGFKLHDTMIWRKSNFSNPSKNRYHQTFEYMFVLAKNTIKTFNPICDRKNIYSGKIGSYGENTTTQKDGSKKIREQKINSEYGMRHNVWDVKTSGQTGESKKYKHPAMFPLELAKDHILTWSNENELIFDPFMGSGTVGVACLQTNRRFIGSEIDADYFSIAKKRIEEIS